MLFRRIMREPDFRTGRIDIRYLERHPELARWTPPDDLLEVAAAAAALLEHEARMRRGVRRIEPRTDGRTGWRRTDWEHR